MKRGKEPTAKHVCDLVDEQRTRIGDAQCLALCIEKTLEPLICEYDEVNAVESVARVLKELLEDIAGKLDPMAMKRTIGAQVTEEAQS